MADPLSEVISLLRPRAVFTKGIVGAGRWGVRYSDFGHPSFCVVVEGACRLAVDDAPALTLDAGDFVLLPTTPGFTIAGFEPVTPVRIDPQRAGEGEGEGADVRHGPADAPLGVRLLGGYFVFDGADSGLLVALLPRQIHIRGVPRLAVLVGLLIEEAAAGRAGRDLVQGRLVDILLVEALRLSATPDAPSGLLRGLADPRLAEALRRIHADPARAWSVAELARAAALSRSSFFDRFTRTLGVAPREYLVAWRMALARDLLRHHGAGIAEVAARVGYASQSTFSTAFSRHVGHPPGRYARGAAA